MTSQIEREEIRITRPPMKTELYSDCGKDVRWKSGASAPVKRQNDFISSSLCHSEPGESPVRNPLFAGLRPKLAHFSVNLKRPWPCHLTVRILPSQGRYTGSIPVRATNRSFLISSFHVGIKTFCIGYPQ